jgi:hypothetical protein
MKSFNLVIVALLLIAFTASISLAENRDDEAEIRRWFRKNLPLVAQELESIKSESPDEYEEELEHWYGLYEEYQEIKREAPEQAAQLLKLEKIDSEARALAMEISEMEDGKSKDRQLRKLRKTVTNLFELRLKLQEEETKELEKEVKELKIIIAKRKKLKKILIEQRLNEMVLENDEVSNW